MHRAAAEIPTGKRCKLEDCGSRYFEWVRGKTVYGHQDVMYR